MDINHRSFQVCRTFQSRACVSRPMLESKHPVNFITTVLLREARYLSRSQTHVCSERRSLWGERSEASFLPAAFKVTAEKQPKCDFSSSEFQNKDGRHRSETSLEQSTGAVDRMWRVLAERFLIQDPSPLVPCIRAALSPPA